MHRPFGPSRYTTRDFREERNVPALNHRSNHPLFILRKSLRNEIA